jgi:hypothetical protein
VAFVLHMTKGWDPKWGGDLVWTSPMTHISPRFNSLTMFPSHWQAWHFIQPVVPHLPAGQQRLSISGWFTTADVEGHGELELSRAARVCAKGRCRRRVLDGTSSQEVWMDDHNGEVPSLPLQAVPGEGEGEGGAVEVAADGSTSNGAGKGQPGQASDLNAADSLFLQHYYAGEKLADHPRAGMLFDRLGRTADAADAFLAFAEYRPTSATLNDAGVALMRDGRLKKAKQTLRKALDMAMEDAEESDEKGALADAVQVNLVDVIELRKAEKEENRNARRQ